MSVSVGLPSMMFPSSSSSSIPRPPTLMSPVLLLFFSGLLQRYERNGQLWMTTVSSFAAISSLSLFALRTALITLWCVYFHLFVVFPSVPVATPSRASMTTSYTLFPTQVFNLGSFVLHGREGRKKEKKEENRKTHATLCYAISTFPYSHDCVFLLLLQIPSHPDLILVGHMIKVVKTLP